MYYSSKHLSTPPPGVSVGFWRLTTAVKWIIIANIAVYVVELLTWHWLRSPAMVANLALVPQEVTGRHAYWQPLTYMWLHDPASPGHLILNMFGLWMFGTVIEERWRPWAFLRFYLLTGLIAGLVVLASGLLTGQVKTVTLGASGAIYGVVIAFGLLFPNITIYFLGIMPIKAKWIVYFTILGTALYWLARAPGISIAAHAGGMAAGALLVSGWWNPLAVARSVGEWRQRRKLRIVRQSTHPRPRGDDEEGKGPVYH